MKTSDTALRQSLVYFGKALERDPTFAEAQAGIAWTWAFLADAYLSPAEAYPKTKVAALKAIALDSLLPRATWRWRWRKRFMIGISSPPSIRCVARSSSVPATRRHIHVRRVLSGMGRFPEAIAQVDSAVQLDRSRSCRIPARLGAVHGGEIS